MTEAIAVMTKPTTTGNAQTLSHHQESTSKRTYTIIGFILIVSFLLNVSKYLWVAAYTWDLNSWGYSEFLINYQGGFVRRGLLGEGLYQLFIFSSFPLKDFLLCFCFLVFFGVVFFFYRQFKKHNICWWLLISPLFLNYTVDIVRKDYLLYAILICIAYLLRPAAHDIIRKIIACVLVVISLLLHEAFFFWGVVLYTILILTDQRHKALNVCLVLIPIVAVGITALFKGSVITQENIVASWNTILPGQPLEYTTDNSIGAIGWSTVSTFFLHLRYNLSTGCGGIVLLPLMLTAAYYLFTNYMVFFHKGTAEDRNAKRLEISLLYPIFCISLIPMLTILSCDTGRVFQYATISTFCTFLILPRQRILDIFPTWYKKIIIKFNSWLDLHFPPTKTVIIFLLLTLAVSPCMFKLDTSWCVSVVGSIISNCLHIVAKFAELFLLPEGYVLN